MNDVDASRRNAVLGRIREKLSGASPASARSAAVAERLDLKDSHLLPERIRKERDDLEKLFSAHLRGQSATVLKVSGEAEVPSAVANWLRSANLPMRVRMGADGRLASVPWSSEPALTIESGRATPEDEVGLSHAVAGVAETGTLVLASGTANPVTLNFMPESHVVVVQAKDIVGPYETAFEKVRAAYGQGVMPRTLNMISGPSRTGDIGGRLVMGAHGPKRMCVVIVGDAA